MWTTACSKSSWCSAGSSLIKKKKKNCSLTELFANKLSQTCRQSTHRHLVWPAPRVASTSCGQHLAWPAPRVASTSRGQLCGFLMQVVTKALAKQNVAGGSIPDDQRLFTPAALACLATDNKQDTRFHQRIQTFIINTTFLIWKLEPAIRIIKMLFTSSCSILMCQHHAVW